MNFKYGAVLTGGIATGKSTVAKIFKSYGINVIDADTVGHQILDIYSSEVNDLFKEDLLTDDFIDRAKLGKVIFYNEKEREKLNKFLHPKIKQEIIMRALTLNNRNIFFIVDIPLYFETNNYSEFDNVIVVYTTPERQLQQLIERNGFSEEEALKRIDSQLPIDEKKDRGNYIINNTSSLENLEKECIQVFKTIQQDLSSN